MQLFTKEKKNIEINVAPLIDIVFLLLIFFMLASEFTDFKTIDMVSPNQKNKEINKSDLPIIIELSENGIININRRNTTSINGVTFISIFFFSLENSFISLF